MDNVVVEYFTTNPVHVLPGTFQSLSTTYTHRQTSHIRLKTRKKTSDMQGSKQSLAWGLQIHLKKATTMVAEQQGDLNLTFSEGMVSRSHESSSSSWSNLQNQWPGPKSIKESR